MKYDFDLELVNSNSLLLILEQITKGSTVLEFGPANGRMTKYLKEKLGCDVYLAEIDEEAGKQALKYGKDLVVGDIENFEWFERYQDIKFDYIIYADVLEHLRDPEQVVAKSKILLKNDGSILLSVPNFAHNAILINLVNNDFQYRNIGLLDDTHIHMFTKNSLENMLHDIELFPVKRMATYSQVGKNEIPADIHWNKGIDDSFWNRRQYGEVYQFVYEVKKGKEFVEEEVNDLKNTLNHYYFQIYFDKGSGLHEEMSIKKAIPQFEGENVFVFDLDDEVERVRIDPVNHKGIMRIESYAVEEGKRYKINTTLSNAMVQRKDIFCFTDDDPWMYYDKNPGIKRIEIHVFYDSLSEETVKAVTLFKNDIENAETVSKEIQKKEDECARIKAGMEMENRDLNQKIEELEDEKARLAAQINVLTETRRNLESKFLYKLYKKVFRH